ncbi:Neutral cholesterol ester hydrolase 1 [Holothuria leucospilota]|uniref:Neutral cholesterol ester hydrolase 1 n=1 Tax=Holothuria leucospilota TaxID=206669 RepID=A0A9Q1BQ50_HOLLE|nr:Neutral cholesterol ester hydrolase 1 [Holothuria leucospilota]
MLPLTSIARFYSYFILGKRDKEFERLYIENKHVAPSKRQSDSMRTFFNHSLIPPEMRSDSYYKGPSDPNLGSEEVWNKIKDVCLDFRFSAFNNLPLNGLPHAYIITCGFDSIRDDGIFYGEALKAAGVEVEWKHYEESFHGIFWASPTFVFELGEQMRKEAMKYEKRKL